MVLVITCWFHFLKKKRIDSIMETSIDLFHKTTLPVDSLLSVYYRLNNFYFDYLHCVNNREYSIYFYLKAQAKKGKCGMDLI